MPESAPAAIAPETPAAASAAPQASSPAPSSPAASPAAAVDAPSSGSAAAATPTPASPEYTDLLEILRQQAPDLAGRFTDGNQALAHLLAERARAAEFSRLAPYAQEYLRHAPQFQEWRRQQQQAQADARAKQSQWFKAPEFDPRWRDAIYQDPQSGELKVKAGFPPDLVQRYTAAVQHQRDFLDRFAFDPISAIKPGLEQLVKELVGPMMQQQVGGYAEQQQAGGFVRENASWLFQNGAPGGPLSEWGQKFAGYVQQAESLGLRTVQQQQQYAMGQVRADFALAKWNEMNRQPAAAPAAPADPNAAAKAAFLQRAAAAPNTAPGGAQRTPAQAVPPQPVQGSNHVNRLTRMLADNARAQGLLSNELVLPG